MISLGALLVRAALRAYTYPYRKNFASLSRSVSLPNAPYSPPKGYIFRAEQFCGVRVEILTPPREERGAIVHFHGGGHTVGMNDLYHKVAERLASLTRCTVFSIDYRTGKELVYPALHDACFHAYRALAETALSGCTFAAVGDSFGANLLLSACLRAREQGLPLPAAAVCVSPFLDMAASGSSYETNCRRDPLYGLPKGYSFRDFESRIRRISPYCGETPTDDPDLSPAYASFDGFPPALILCGGYETSLSDGEMLLHGMQRAGSPAKLHVFEGMWHDFMYLFPHLKESKRAWREAGDFLIAALSKQT